MIWALWLYPAMAKGARRRGHAFSLGSLLRERKLFMHSIADLPLCFIDQICNSCQVPNQSQASWMELPGLDLSKLTSLRMRRAPASPKHMAAWFLMRIERVYPRGRQPTVFTTQGKLLRKGFNPEFPCIRVRFGRSFLPVLSVCPHPK